MILRTRHEADLTSAGEADKLFKEAKPQIVVLAAAKVGGILANSQYPADFLRENLAIQLNVIDASLRFGVEKLAFLGFLLYLSKTRPATDQRGVSSNWTPRNHQRVVCDCKNRWY